MTDIAANDDTAKKKTLFLTIGPPMVAPNWLRCRGGFTPPFGLK